jgi:hypothetical protein
MNARATFALFAALALLSACHRQEGRGGLTADEEQQLDNAAAMLDANTFDANTIELPDDSASLNADDEGGNDAVANDADAD